MHPRGAIQKYVDGDLGPRREAALRRHLSHCEACRSYYEDQVALIRILRVTKGEPTEEENDRLLARVMDAATEEGLFASAGERSHSDAAARARIEIPKPSIVTRWLDRLILRPLPAAAGAFVLALLVTGTFISWDFVLQLGQEARAPVAHMTEARELTLDGHRLAVSDAAKRPIYDGERISIGDEGLAEMALVSGGTIRFFPRTDSLLDEGGRLVVLDRGRIWCKVEASEAPFVVRTPHGEARVLGTSFIVDSSEQKTEVRVLEGRVEVVDAAGIGRVEVPAGRQTSIGRGSAPTRPVAYDSQRDQSEWARLWGRLLDTLQRALDGVRDAFRSDR